MNVIDSRSTSINLGLNSGPKRVVRPHDTPTPFMIFSATPNMVFSTCLRLHNVMTSYYRFFLIYQQRLNRLYRHSTT